MRKIKHITAFVLLPLALLPVILSVLFLVQRQYIWEHMEEALEEEQLVSVLLSSEEVTWHKKGKEIIISGHLFDVKSIVPAEDGKVQVTGLYDYQEQALHASLNKAVDSGGSAWPILLCLGKWMSLLYHDHLEYINKTPQIANTHHSHSLNDLLYLPVRYPSIITPPPRLAA